MAELTAVQKASMSAIHVDGRLAERSEWKTAELRVAMMDVTKVP